MSAEGAKREPDKEDLEKAYAEAEEIYEKYLKDKNVKLPKWDSAKGYWLSILFYYMPKWVSKDEIADIVRKHKPGIGGDQQVRHLKRDGWNVDEDGKGNHAIKNPREVHPGYEMEQNKRAQLQEAGDFEDIKKAWGYKCASCGSKEGEEHRNYPGSVKVKLEEGHRDPEKPLDVDNVIPQCQYCNKAYKDDFTFDEKGRVRAVASSGPVLRASKRVREEIMKELRESEQGQ